MRRRLARRAGTSESQLGLAEKKKNHGGLGSEYQVDAHPNSSANDESWPRDGAAWTQRLKEEYKALIAYTQMNKSNDNDWFRISAANPEGTRWTGKCWYVHNLLKYEFDLQFDIPITYPSTAPELELPELDGKTQKMYRGGKICLTIHFKPLWAKNSPRFGIAHALCLGLAPWLAAEVPILVDSGMIKHKDNTTSTSES
ncbi:Ubiquitin-fold modifier-conjugating enzyme 1, partial [Cucurbita argyrosperma subsp. sororia]